jgi:hypothetical protein
MIMHQMDDQPRSRIRLIEQISGSEAYGNSQSEGEIQNHIRFSGGVWNPWLDPSANDFLPNGRLEVLTNRS